MPRFRIPSGSLTSSDGIPCVLRCVLTPYVVSLVLVVIIILYASSMQPFDMSCTPCAPDYHAMTSKDLRYAPSILWYQRCSGWLAFRGDSVVTLRTRLL